METREPVSPAGPGTSAESSVIPAEFVSGPVVEVAGAATGQCVLCGVSVPSGDLGFVNGKETCPACADQVRRELQAERVEGRHLPLAIVGGGLGALVSAAVWAAIAIATEFEIGYIAVLLGFLAGWGVKLGAGRARGVPLQVIAVVWSLLGLFIAKYAIVAGILGRDYGLPYVGAETFDVFLEVLPEMVSPFDLLWVVLAVGAAWRVPRASAVHVS